jgi:FSR family fosmidomycin resistance protein-like MFS transporter
MKTRSVMLLVFAHAAADINQGSIPVLLPYFIAEHHITYAAAAAAVFITNLVSTVMQPVCGHIVDRRSRPWLIPVSMIVIGLGVSFMGLAPTYRIGLAALVLSGFGIAMFHPEGARLINHLSQDSKATAMSFFGIGGQLGFAIGPLIGTAALLAWGLKGTTVLIVPTIIVAALVAFKMPGLMSGYETKGSGHGTQTLTAGRDVWPAFACLASALLIRSVIFYGLSTFLPLFWIDVLHQSKTAGGTALAVLLGSSMAGNFMGGKTADRVGLRTVTVTAFALLAAIFPFLAYAQSASVALLLLIPIGVLLSAPFGAMIVLGQSYLPNRVGLASGITLGLAFSFGGLTTPLMGWIADHHGLRTTISVVSFLPIACTALALMLPRVQKEISE